MRYAVLFLSATPLAQDVPIQVGAARPVGLVRPVYGYGNSCDRVIASANTPWQYTF